MFGIDSSAKYEHCVLCLWSFANSERFVIFYNFTVCEHVPNSHKKTCSHNQNVHISQRSHKEECTVYIYIYIYIYIRLAAIKYRLSPIELSKAFFPYHFLSLITIFMVKMVINAFRYGVVKIAFGYQLYVHRCIDQESVTM